MRLVCFGDIHMALGAIDRLGSELGAADVAILTGDLTTFGDPPDAERVVSAVRAHCPTVLAVTGNLDMPWVIDTFRTAGISLHGEGRRFGTLGVFGCGGSNITPMDTPTELEEDELRAVLERGHAAVADAPQRLMICHTPPFDTRLDRLMNGTPVGSPAVRAFIERRAPDLAVVGHIHEGRGVDRVGGTVVLNAGALRDGGYVVIEHEGDALRAELRNFRSAGRAVPGADGRIEAVTLDAAGTLFTVAEPVGTTYARIAARYGIDRLPSELEARFRAAFRAAPPLACPDVDPVRLDACERAWWQRVVSETLHTADAPGFDACFDELLAYFADPGAWRVYPDVRPALTRLRAADIRLGVVSNFDRRLGTILTGLGLAPLFDLVVPSSVAGAAKPASAIFARALAGLGVAAARALHAGDGLREDVYGARSAGLRAVLVDRATEPDAFPGVTVVHTLMDLLPIVDASSR